MDREPRVAPGRRAACLAGFAALSLCGAADAFYWPPMPESLSSPGGDTPEPFVPSVSQADDNPSLPPGVMEPPPSPPDRGPVPQTPPAPPPVPEPATLVGVGTAAFLAAARARLRRRA